MVQVIRHSVTENNYDVITEVDESDFIQHHGILGMKWGVRRYQNEDGSLTAAGRSHYGVARERMKSAVKTYLGGVGAAAAVGTHLASKEAAKDIVVNNHSTFTLGAQGITERMNSGTVLREGSKLAKQMQTPVGKAITAAVAAGALSAAIYNAYKVKKLGDIQNIQADELQNKADKYIDKGTPLNVVLNSSNNKGMIAMVPAGTLPESTRITGKEEEEYWKELAKYYQEQEKNKSK